MPRKKQKLKHNHRYGNKNGKKFRNILNQINSDKMDFDIKRSRYLGYWRKLTIKNEAAKMAVIRNQMRADVGLPPL